MLYKSKERWRILPGRFAEVEDPAIVISSMKSPWLSSTN